MRILHLIHATTFGGVEAAAEHLRSTVGRGARTRVSGTSATAVIDEPIEYRVGALAGAPEGQEAVHAHVTGSSVNSPLSALRLLREVRSTRPEVLVTSLWRVVALGPIARLLSPGTRWIVWVHLAAYTNAADRLVHTWCLPRADAILCDSDASYEAIVRPALARAGTAVPHRIVRPESSPLDASGPGRTAPVADEPLCLVFWGRMARQKRLDRVVELAQILAARRPGGVELLIAGPDDGERHDLEQRAARSGPGLRIELLGPLDRTGVERAAGQAHVFVQLSDVEGYAMSAHEALAAGMLCVLTPVGDLAADTTDGVDAVHHHGDLEDTAGRVLAVTSDPAAFDAMGRAATATAGHGFTEAFVEACRDLTAERAR